MSTLTEVGTVVVGETVEPGTKVEVRSRFDEHRRTHDALRAGWQEDVKKQWKGEPMSLPRLAHEIWQVIKNEDWVLTSNTLEDWTLGLWDFDKTYRHPGKSLSTSTQIGMSTGVALAHRLWRPDAAFTHLRTPAAQDRSRRGLGVAGSWPPRRARR